MLVKVHYESLAQTAHNKQAQQQQALHTRRKEALSRLRAPVAGTPEFGRRAIRPSLVTHAGPRP